MKFDQINIMNIINYNTFNLQNSLLNNDNRRMKVVLMKVKANRSCDVAYFGWLLRIFNLHMVYKTKWNFKRYFVKKKCTLYADKYDNSIPK